MNHKNIVNTFVGILLLTNVAFPQTDYTPVTQTPQSVPVTPALQSNSYNSNITNPASVTGTQNTQSGTLRMEDSSLPTGNAIGQQPTPNFQSTPGETNVQAPQTTPNIQSTPNETNTQAPQTTPNIQQGRGVTQRPVAMSNAPFELTPQQQDQVNRVLAFWESYTRGIKKFEADFDLYTYPAVSVGGTDVNSAPKSQKTTGFLKYEAPSKGVFRVDGPPKELYRCNGKSVFTYNFDKKEVNEYKYSDGSGKTQELNKGPMAFLFGASATTLRDRYWIRLLPLPQGAPEGQIWLEAYPKYQEDLQDMTKAELIINVKPCKPVAFQRYAPNGDRQSYALKNIKVNKFELFGGEPFEPNERGWTIVPSSEAE